MDIRIRGLPAGDFGSLFPMSTAELRRRGIERLVVDASPGYPDRITLDDAPIGESVLLMNFVHQSAATPFRASHAIYVRERAVSPFDRVNEVPPALARRLIALRAFDRADRMIDADITDGSALLKLAGTMLQGPRAAYLHAHYAKWGCYAARVERA